MARYQCTPRAYWQKLVKKCFSFFDSFLELVVEAFWNILSVRSTRGVVGARLLYCIGYQLRLTFSSGIGPFVRFFGGRRAIIRIQRSVLYLCTVHPHICSHVILYIGCHHETSSNVFRFAVDSLSTRRAPCQFSLWLFFLLRDLWLYHLPFSHSYLSWNT